MGTLEKNNNPEEASLFNLAVEAGVEALSLFLREPNKTRFRAVLNAVEFSEWLLKNGEVNPEDGELIIRHDEHDDEE